MKEIKNAKEYQEIISANKPVLLDFYADWCGPCQSQLPVLEDLALLHESDFEIAKINVDTNPELANKFGVRSIPALFFIQDGEIKESLNGFQSESVLENKLNQYSETVTL